MDNTLKFRFRITTRVSWSECKPRLTDHTIYSLYL